jgi:hypothetical protein
LPRSAERSGIPRGLRLALALLVLGGAVFLASRGGLPSVESPEREATAAAAKLSRLEALSAGDARLDLDALALRDVTVAMDGALALVVAVADADGRARFDGQAPTVSYVGRERFAMERCPGARWCPEDGVLEALRGVVGALVHAPRPTGARILAWQIRVERDTATAGEDHEVGEGTATRRARASFALRRGEAGWALVSDRAP